MYGTHSLIAAKCRTPRAFSGATDRLLPTHRNPTQARLFTLSRPFLLVRRIKLSLLALSAVAPVLGQTPDQVAETLLSSARKGYNEKQFSFAQARFKEFLQKFGGHKDASAARYGLGLAILDGPGRSQSRRSDAGADPGGRRRQLRRPASMPLSATSARRSVRRAWPTCRLRGRSPARDRPRSPSSRTTRSRSSRRRLNSFQPGALQPAQAARHGRRHEGAPRSVGVGRADPGRRRRDAASARQTEGGPRHRGAVPQGSGPVALQVQGCRPLLLRPCRVPPERHADGPEDADDAAPVRGSRMGDARPLSAGANASPGRRAIRGVVPLRGIARGSEEADRHRPGTAEGSQSSRRRPGPAAPGRRAPPADVAGPCRPGHVLSRRSPLRSRQIRRGEGAISRSSPRTSRSRRSREKRSCGSATARCRRRNSPTPSRR